MGTDRVQIHRGSLPIFLTLAACLPALLAGCMAERSFPASADRVVRLAADAQTEGMQPREWLRSAESQLAPLLPKGDRPPLLTDDLARTNGTPTNVYRYFGVRGDRMHTLLWNLRGIQHTAQVAQQEKSDDPPSWDGFNDVWIPVSEKIQLSGRLGLSRDAAGARYADCIIVLPGILGDKSITRTRDICTALRDAGHHVLALDLRGLGQTRARHPETYSTFGALETGDLLAVSAWLEAKSYVHETGLIGFCWGANQALLVAWEDGRRDDDPCVGEGIRSFLRPRDGRRHFGAGIIAYSPVMRFEDVIARTATPCPAWLNPVLNGLQKRVLEHMQERGYPSPGGCLRDLFRAELVRSEFGRCESIEEDGLRYLRLMPYLDKTTCNKLDAARMPVLIVHAVNDPLAPAQDVADLVSQVGNPNVAAMILAGGGHDGFAPYASDHFYSLMLNYFDRSYGAAAALERLQHDASRLAAGTRR